MRRIFILLGFALACADVSAQRMVRSVDTLSQLLARNPNDADTNVWVSGRTVIGDGFEGLFTYDRLSAAAENLGTVFKPNAYNGRWKRRDVRELDIRWFGAIGDGVSDDSSAINSAISAIDTNVRTIRIPAGIFGIGARLDGTRTNVRFVGEPGATLRKLSSSGSFILSSATERYQGYSFTGIKFDGNSAAIGAAGALGISAYLVSAQDVSFVRCEFRDANYGAIVGSGASNILIDECYFPGVKEGLMQAGVMTPPAVAGAAYRSAIDFRHNCRNITVRNSRFHYVHAGVRSASADAGIQGQSTGITVENNLFYTPWWTGPYVTVRFTPVTYTATNRQVVAAAGTFTGHLNTNEIVTIPRAMANGTAFTSITADRVQTSASMSPGLGDVIETSDGKRAEIRGFRSNTDVDIEGWQDIATFEPSTPPALGATWRVRRYYAAIANKVNDTTFTFAYEPVNPNTGETLTSAGLDPTTVECFVNPKTEYAGVHMERGSEKVQVKGNTVVGSFGDQLSFTGSTNLVIQGNHLDRGQDMGITLNETMGAVAKGNDFRFTGVNPIWVNGSYNSIEGNHAYSWGLAYQTTFAVRGLVLVSGPYNSICDNIGSYNLTATFGGSSSNIVELVQDQNVTGCVVSGNGGFPRDSAVYVGSGTSGMRGSGNLSYSGPGVAAFIEDIPTLRVSNQVQFSATDTNLVIRRFDTDVIETLSTWRAENLQLTGGTIPPYISFQDSFTPSTNILVLRQIGDYFYILNNASGSNLVQIDLETADMHPSLDNSAYLGIGSAEWAAVFAEYIQFDENRWIRNGAGSPEGVHSANRGSIWLRTDGGVGTTVYFKEATDGGNTGWTAVASGGGGADDQTAAEVPFAPAGGIAATDVQAALAELDTEKQAADADLATYAGLATTGLVARTGAGTAATRTITGDAEITVTNGDGVAGNPTLAVASALTRDTELPATQTGTHASPSTTNPLSPTWTVATHAVWYGATGTINLPAASGYTGKGLLVYNTGAFTITIDPNGTEVVVRDGNVQTGGVSMTLSSGAGNYVALWCDGARWVTLGYKGTLAVGS